MYLCICVLYEYLHTPWPWNKIEKKKAKRRTGACLCFKVWRTKRGRASKVSWYQNLTGWLWRCSTSKNLNSRQNLSLNIDGENVNWEETEGWSSGHFFGCTPSPSEWIKISYKLLCPTAAAVAVRRCLSDMTVGSLSAYCPSEHLLPGQFTRTAKKTYRFVACCRCDAPKERRTDKKVWM